MIYSETQIQKIHDLASFYLPVRDIAILIGVDPDTLRDDIRNHSHMASVGKLETKVALYSQEVKLASIGSPLALENARRNLLDMEDDE